MAVEDTYAHVRLTSDRLATDVIEISRLHGEERLGGLFAFDVDIAVLDTTPLQLSPLLGAEVALVFEQEGFAPRTIHAMVSSITDLLVRDRSFLEYRLRLVPRAYRLALNETQEVFLGQTVPQIVSTKLARAGLTAGHDTLSRLTAVYRPRDLVVQYQESDLAFVSRLLEHVGVTMLFDHDEGRDRIVFSDSNEGFTPCPGGPVPYGQTKGTRWIFEVTTTSILAPTCFTVVDYYEQNPRLDLTSSHVPTPGAGSERAVVEYGSSHRSPEEGARLAKIRAEERASRNDVWEGGTNAFELAAGRTFEVEGHERIDQPLLVTSVTHDIVQSVMSGEGVGVGRAPVRYTNRFTAHLLDVAYRPPRVTPKPRIAGLLHAITEGLPTATTKRIANLDPEGRYTVRFYFDMSPDARGVSSPRVRMMQPHAGPGYGMHFPLKPDVEVLVAFVDGDPDRPIIVGAVPNPLTASPVTLANPQAHKLTTESGLFLVMKDL